MANLPLTFASGLYDRMLPLYTGEVRPEGIDLTFVANDVPTDLFTRALAGEFEASELSSSHFVRLIAGGDDRFVGIPVFPSRVFRHGQIAIRRDAGIESPRDLEGRRIGVPEYGMSAAVWIRGILKHDYGVDLSTVRWMQDPARRRSGAVIPALAARTPAATIEENESGKPVSTLLEEGALDAFIGADLPESLRKHPNVRRLFPDYREVEKAYYRRTRIFPIMHAVVIRRDVYERHPFVARSLYDALTRSKDAAREKMRYMGTLRYMVPWLIADVEESDEVFGGDPFAYGLEPNRPTLEALITNLADQGLIDAPFPCERLFVPV